VLRRVGSRVVVGAAVAAGVVGGVASPAGAPKYIFGASAYGRCDLGRADDALFQGDFVILSFFASGGVVYANASLGGSCLEGADVVVTSPAKVYAFPVAVVAECVPGSAVLEIRPGAAQVSGVLGTDTKDGTPVTYSLDLSTGTVVDRIALAGDPARERAKICAIARIAPNASAKTLARALDELSLRL
jgi:hypothetical protein